MRIVAAMAAALPPFAAAQAWVVHSGAAVRGEFNDNYFFTPIDQQSAYTASISPFVAAARLTEASDVTALLAVGANKVWGLTEKIDYVGGRFGLDGTLRDARSTWTGNASFVRAPSLQSELRQAAVIFGLTNTNTAVVGATYTYTLAERWSLGATAGGNGNRYDALESGGSSLPSNRGYNAGGNVGYAFSDRTQLTFIPVFSHFASDITRSDNATATLGIVHQLSPQLTMSASVGGFWSDSESVDTGDRRRDSGQLYGGSISYAFTERTHFAANLREGLTPSGIGSVAKSEGADASLLHRFSDRFSSRLGINYTSTKSTDGLAGTFTNKDFRGEIGVSYLFAERLRLDAGYRYARARYSQNTFEPKSNVAFLSIAYNWPGASFTDWVGSRPDVQGVPGAGPVSLPGRPHGTAASAESSPFDRFSIP